MKKKYIVELTEDERSLLLGVVKKLKGTSGKVKLAQILLKADAGGPKSLSNSGQDECFKRPGLEAGEESAIQGPIVASAHFIAVFNKLKTAVPVDTVFVVERLQFFSPGCRRSRDHRRSQIHAKPGTGKAEFIPGK